MLYVLNPYFPSNIQERGCTEGGGGTLGRPLSVNQMQFMYPILAFKVGDPGLRVFSRRFLIKGEYRISSSGEGAIYF